MIKPVKMQKISAVVLDDKKDAVLRELKERSVIQFLKIEEGEETEGFGLTPGRTSGNNVKAAELLSDVEGMLEVFELAKDGNGSLLEKLSPEPPTPVGTEESSPQELFAKASEKLDSLRDKVLGISSRMDEIKKEREEVMNAQEVMSKLKPLKIGPAELDGFESSFVATGMIPTSEVEDLKEKVSEETDLYYIKSVEEDKGTSVAIVISLKEFEADIRRILHIHRFEEFRVSKTFSHLTVDSFDNELKSQLSKLEEEEGTLLKEIKEIKEAEKNNLQVIQEKLAIEKKLDEASTYFGNTKSTFLLRGWVPTSRTNEVMDAIQRASEGEAVTMVEESHGHGHDEEAPPTLLKNSKIAKPMEMMVKTYGIPTYDMIDPSIMMAISFPLIFGLMFGDVGQGFVLFTLGAVLGFVLKTNEGTMKLGRVLLSCGLAAMIGGLLYGEVFTLEGIIKPLWMSPMHAEGGIMKLITLSFYLAVAQVSIGCFIKIADELSHGKPLHAIFNAWGIMGLWFLWGGFLFIKGNGLDATLNYIFSLIGIGTATRGESIAALGLPIMFPLAMIAIGGKFVEGLSPGWAVYEAYEAFSRYLFNSLSYVRIAALALVHAVFAMVTNMGLNGVTGMHPESLAGHISAITSGPIVLVLWVLIWLAGNAFIILLETLISFIHTLRLHYYEWFSKFYEGGGSPFEPFEVKREYTFLTPEKGG